MRVFDDRRVLVGCARAGVVAASLLCATPLWAQARTDTDATAKVGAGSTERDLQQWLLRLHEASRRRSYTGTFVVSAGPDMAVSKIWHVCDGQQQYERIDALTGVARTTLRRDDEVVTFWPQARAVLKEKRDMLRLFPDLLRAPGADLRAYYRLHLQGQERVAGLDADVLELLPRDALRYGYRIWSEKKTGLVLKLQIRDEQGQVLEQVAFTELKLDAPVKMDALARQMRDTQGYQVHQAALQKTTPEAQGWRLAQEVPGFQSVSSHVRTDGGRSHPPLQWVFSDGLTSVSLFVEPLDPRRHGADQLRSSGATQVVARRWGDQHWVSAMGEVPPATLRRFIDALERSKP